LGVNPGVFANKSLIKALLETSYVWLAVLVAFPISLSRVGLGVISPLVRSIAVLEFWGLLTTIVLLIVSIVVSKGYSGLGIRSPITFYLL
jgi:hypothetical protein